MNKAILIGNLTKDPDLRYTSSNVPVASFTVAVNERYGEKDITDFLQCRAWKHSAELVSKYCKKGDKIAVGGKIKSDSWEDDEGNKRYSTYILVNEIKFLTKKEVKEDNQPEKDTDPFAEFGEEVVITDDDLPF